MDLATAPKTSSFATLPAPQQADGMVALSPAKARSLSIRAGWSALAADAAEPNAFFEPWFVLPSVQAFAPRTGLSVMAYFEDGDLAGLMPLAASRDYYGYALPHRVTWLHENAFCGAPLIAKGCEDAFWRALLAHLDRAPGAALLAHFPALPEGGPAHAALLRVCEQEGRAQAIVQARTRAMLASRLAPQDYANAALSKKHRKELARQMRRLGDEGAATFERSTGTQDLGEWAQDYLALEAAGWKGKAGSALGSNAASARFFEQVIEGAGRAGRLERLTLRLEGSPIAMLATFLAQPGAFAFKTAYDEGLARYSPGLQLQLQYLDTLSRGDTEWTDSCASEGHPMIERLWQERRTLVSCNVALGGRLRRGLLRPLIAYETRERS